MQCSGRYRLNQLKQIRPIIFDCKVKKSGFKKNQKLMIESVNDVSLSLSLCLHVTAYRNGKKVYRTKVGKRTASSGSFCCFLGFFWIF